MKTKNNTKTELNRIREIFCNPAYNQLFEVCNDDLNEVIDGAYEIRLVELSGKNLKDILDNIDSDYAGSSYAEKALMLIRINPDYQINIGELSSISEFTVGNFRPSCEVKWGIASLEGQQEKIQVFLLTSWRSATIEV